MIPLSAPPRREYEKPRENINASMISAFSAPIRELQGVANRNSMHRYIFDPHPPNVNDDECKKINDKFQRAGENVRKRPPEKIGHNFPPTVLPVGTFWPAGSSLQYPKSSQLCEQKPC